MSSWYSAVCALRDGYLDGLRLLGLVFLNLRLGLSALCFGQLGHSGDFLPSFEVGSGLCVDALQAWH